MSKISTIRPRIRDLNALEAALKDMNGTLIRDQKTYRQYGSNTRKCDHAISFSDERMEMGLIKLGNGGIDNELTTNPPDTHARQRIIKGNIGDSHGRRSADDAQDIGIVFLVGGKNHHVNLHFIAESLREQRAQRAVDHPRRENLLFRRPAFTFEESAGDLPRRVGLLAIIDLQGEKILGGIRLLV